MANVFMAPGETFTVQDKATVFGSTGVQTLKVLGTPDVTVNSQIENIVLDGALSNYTFEVEGTQVYVRQDGAMVTSIGVQPDANGTGLTFADGTAELKLTGLNQATLGGVPVSTTDGGTPLDVPVSGGNTINVSGAGTSEVGSDHFTVIFAVGSYSHTVNGFGTGDKIDLPNDFLATATVKNLDGADGELILSSNSEAAQVITITLTGIDLAQDAGVFAITSFNNVFGGGSLF